MNITVDGPRNKFQRQSRPVKIGLVVLALIAANFVILKPIKYLIFGGGEPVSTSDSPYTNEELNDILKGDTTSDENDFNIYRKPIEELKLESPMISPTTLELNNFVNKGNALIGNEKIRLVSDKAHQAGSLFSKTTIPAHDSFEMELEFGINGAEAKNGLYGDGLAIWIVDEPLEGGEVFGMENKWNGIGLFLDTFQNNNDKSVKNRGFPYASLQYNQGHSNYYDKDADGVKTEVAGCSLTRLHNPRFGKSKLRLIYLRESGYLSVDFDIKNNGNWKNCFTINNEEDGGIKLPLNSYVGFSGETGELHHNVDLFKFEVNALYDDEHRPVKSIKAINDDLEYHAKKEEEQAEKEKSQENLNLEREVIKSTHREKVVRKQRLARDGRNRRRTLTRLHKAESRLKKRILKDNQEYYGGHDGFISYTLHLIKNFIIFVVVLIGLYGLSIVFRAYRDNSRVRSKTYYRGAIL